ncbi:uncharacterized protein LOC144469052 [Augochlora pura]
MARKRMIKRRKSCSTPKKLVSEVPSVSISSITPNSSLSDERFRRRFRTQVNKEAEVNQKRKKRELHAVPKRKVKKRMKRKIRKEPEESDSSWETTLEIIDDEKENVQPPNSSPKSPPLFQSRLSQSLERVREAHYFDDLHLDSPIFRHNKNAASPVKAGLEDGVESLYLKDLPSVHPLVYSSDEEDDLLLTRNHNKPPRTYPSVRHRRKPQISVDKSKRWLVDVKCPTVAADKLWDEYVRTHPEEMREYIAPPTDQNVTSLSESKKNNYGRDEAYEIHGKKYRFPSVAEDASNDKYYSISGHYSKFTKKWVQKEYPDAEDSDSDFGRTETGAPKLTLNQYLEKCRAQKHLVSQMAGPSYSKCNKFTNVTTRKRKIVNDDNTQDLRVSKSTPVIRSIETLKRIKYIRKGFQWCIVRK